MASDAPDNFGQPIEDTLVVVVKGTPRPQPRPRFVGMGRVVSTADRGTREWAERVRGTVRQALADRYGSMFPGFAGPLQVDLCFVMPIQDKKRHGEFCAAKPDGDNLAKLIFDRLEKAGMFATGDQQIVCGSVMKLYGPPDRAGVSITVSPPRADTVSGMLLMSGGVGQGVDRPDWLA